MPTSLKPSPPALARRQPRASTGHRLTCTQNHTTPLSTHCLPQPWAAKLLAWPGPRKGEAHFLDTLRPQGWRSSDGQAKAPLAKERRKARATPRSSCPVLVCVCRRGWKRDLGKESRPLLSTEKRPEHTLLWKSFIFKNRKEISLLSKLGTPQSQLSSCPAAFSTPREQCAVSGCPPLAGAGQAPACNPHRPSGGDPEHSPAGWKHNFSPKRRKRKGPKPTEEVFIF